MTDETTSPAEEPENPMVAWIRNTSAKIRALREDVDRLVKERSAEEKDLRAEALAAAIKIQPNDLTGDSSTVVEDARMFFDFLSGDSRRRSEQAADVTFTGKIVSPSGAQLAELMKSVAFKGMKHTN